MKWIGRALAWVTLWSGVSLLLAGPYQQLLSHITAALLHLRLASPDEMTPDLAAANALGVYAGLCMASSCQPSWRQGRAVIAGLIVLMALELMAGLLSIQMGRAFSNLSPTAIRIGQALLDVQRWGSVPLVWFAQIGRSEFAKRNSASCSDSLHVAREQTGSARRASPRSARRGKHPASQAPADRRAIDQPPMEV